MSLSLNCALEVGGLGPGTEIVEETEGQANAYRCQCNCTAFLSGSNQPFELKVPPLNVCVPFELNPNRNQLRNGAPVTDAEISADCSDRVLNTFEAMAQECMVNPFLAKVICDDCTAVPSARFVQACDDDCAAIPIEFACINFNPEGGPAETTATVPNPPADFEPVCVALSDTSSAQSALVADAALPTAAPTPLAGAIFGQRSTCVLDSGQSTATVTLDTEVREPKVNGIVEFLGAPCLGAACAVGMTYQLDLEPFSFNGFCAGTEITDVRTVGTATSGAISLNVSGVAQIAPGQTLTSVRGTRKDTGICITDQEFQMSFVGTNVDSVDVTVDWANKTCKVNGTLLGATVENSNTLSVEVNLQGTLVNQSPTAKAGVDQTIECTSSAGAEVTLDGTGSSDPDNNIALVQWLQGSRTGALVGDVLRVTLAQGVGTTGQYILRVIDASAQADEDTTTVQVDDTTAPTITAVKATPNVLKPPNDKMVPVTIAVSAVDACDAQPVCQLMAITGNGNGRVYTLTVECKDATGNRAQGTTTVTVPH